MATHSPSIPGGAFALPRTCAEGNHRPRRVRLSLSETKLHTTCRDCGCDLVRTQATRRWYYSGTLGAT